MKSPIAFRPRERRLALFAAVLIGCWAFLSWLVQPLWEEMRGLQLHVETQADRLASLDSLLARAPSIEREYHSIASYLASAEKTEGEPAAFLQELEALSRQSRVRLNLKPRPARPRGDDVTRFEVELDAEGSQDDLMAFLDTLLRLPELIEVQRLRLSAVPAKSDTLRATVVLQKLFL